MIDLDLLVKEILALRANQEDLARRVDQLEEEMCEIKVEIYG